MSVTYNAEEVFRIAEQIERNGREFYQQAAGRFKNDTRQKLLQLSLMEQGHEAYFRGLRQELFKPGPSASSFDPDGEVERYLAALASGHIFDPNRKVEDVLAAQQSLKDILRFAIEREKESVLFYLGLKKLVPTELGKSRVDEIIDEEMSHIILLTDELFGLLE